MNHALSSALLSLALFAGMLLLLEVGRRIGARRIAEDPAGATAGVAAVEGAILGLLGLLLAFTFSGASARFDARRELIVQEVNAIDTAHRRLDLLPPGAQPALREDFRRYLDARIEVYRKLPNIDAARAEQARVTELQGSIWRAAVAACAAADRPQVVTLVLPAINAMSDITTRRTMAARMHPPTIVFVMLFVVALVSALLAGYGLGAGKRRKWVHVLGFAVTLALVIYVVLDVEYPRLGLIQVGDFDQALVALRASMQ